MLHTYIVHNLRETVIMITIFPGHESVRVQENTFSLGSYNCRKDVALALRYWRRCGWTIRRIV